jgi:ATPase family associated with various cellular activities (AAA)/Winged helix domain, variant
MSATKQEVWLNANSTYLNAALAVVRLHLEACVGINKDGPSGKNKDNTIQQAQKKWKQAGAKLKEPTALDVVCSMFDLSSFERDILLLCAGMELDWKMRELVSAALGNINHSYPTFDLMLAVLPEAHWSALTPISPLRRWRLIEVEKGESLTQSPLRIDERVLHFLTGAPYLDVRLHGLIESVPIPSTLPVSHQKLSQKIVEWWSQPTANPAVIQLCGKGQQEKLSLAAKACSQLGLHMISIRAADLPKDYAERDALTRLLEREVLLGNSVVLLDCDEVDQKKNATFLAENLNTLVLVSATEPITIIRRSMARIDVDKPGIKEQLSLWQEALGTKASKLNGQLETLVSHFNLGADAIQAASTQYLNGAPLKKKEIGEALWEACRVQARRGLDHLARRIEPAANWNDLVLPELQRRTLQDIAAHVRQRSKVYESWGFAAKSSRGLGISALFAGVSGTGKTLAAEVLANELKLDLYHIDLSQVVNKYIGETEKNLSRIFDAAEEGGAVLLFDEADALFGKRSEVKDSHDRYANIEVSYLLQRMESYRGLAILTTNMKKALDDAFLRRIRFVVQFPFPDTAQRAEIWRRVFPKGTPKKNLDIKKLACLNVTGGNIHNIALHAAFLAADTGKPVDMDQLLRAARTEYAKIEKPLTDNESRNWV